MIHREELVDENPHVRISLADVELPDGTQFSQYVFRMRRCVMVLILDEAGTHILLIWRHRFIPGQWVWEVPGGYINDDEEAADAAAREAVEETGWRLRETPQLLLSFQPMIGNADFPQDLYLARGAEQVGDPASDEADSVRWISLDDAENMIKSGEIIGASTIIAVQQALLLQAGDPSPEH